MKTKLCLTTEKVGNPDIIELPTYFHENLTFDVNHAKMRFASQEQVENLKKRGLAKLKEQKAKLQSWLNIDKDLGFDMFFDFTENFEKKDKIEMLQIFNSQNIISEKQNELAPLGEEKWRVESLNGIAEVTGCDLSQRLAKLSKQVNIRAKAFTMNINFVLWGDSSLSVITRSKQYNEETTVIKFMKTGVGAEQRLFLYFGILDKSNKDIVFTKRTEIPVFLTDETQIKNNYIEISCCIHDNGDQFLIVSGEVNHSSKYHFKAKYEQIIPYFEDFNVYLYGDRPCVILKKLRLKLLQRKDLSLVEAEKVANHDCCSMF